MVQVLSNLTLGWLRSHHVAGDGNTIRDGYDLFEESLHSRLIIAHPGIKSPGEPANSMVETIDIFPTIADLAGLAGLPHPDFSDAVSLHPILNTPAAPGHDAISYTNARTIRTKTHRLIQHKDSHIELCDHRSSEAETCNIASEQPGVVKNLIAALRRRLDEK